MMKERIKNESNRSLQVLRIVSFLAAFLYISFGFLLKHVFHLDDIIPLVHRLLFAAGFGGIALLSYLSSSLRQHLERFVYALGSLSIIHLVFMGTHGGFDTGAIVALLLGIPVMNFLFYRWKSLLYGNFLLLAGILGAFLAASPSPIQTLFFILSSLSIGVVSFWFARRLFSSEKRASENERLFHDLFNHSMEGIAIHELIFNEEGEPVDYIFLEVNSTFETYTGLKRADILGKRVRDVLPGIEETPLIDTYGQVVLTNESISFEEYIEQLEGYYRVAAYPVGGDGFATVFEDITKSREDREALQESQKQYASLVENVPGVVYRCLLDEHWTMLYISDEIHHITGYQSSDFLHNKVRSYASIIHPEDSELVTRTIYQAIEENRPWEMEYRLMHKEGEIRWVEEKGQLVVDEYCQVESLTGLILDITKQKLLELEVAEQQERLEIFFSQSLNGCFFMMLDRPISWDHETDKERALEYVFAHQRMTKVNDALLRQYGAQEATLLGKTPYELFKHDLDHGYKIWKDLFDRGHLHVERDERREDGSPMIIEGDYICLYDGEGRITGHFGVQQDITERKQEQEQRKFYLCFQELVAEASAAFVRVTTDEEFDRAVDETLQHLGELFGADRSYLFQFSEDLEYMSNTHEWCEEGIESQKDRIQNQSTHSLPWWRQQILQHRPVPIPDVEKLPQEAENERREFMLQDIGSLICLPTIGLHGHLSGFIGFDMIKKTYQWTQEQITILQIVADSIGSVLERRRAEQALRESEERHRISVEQSRDAIMNLSPPSWRFTSGNPATITMFGVKDLEEFTSLGPWDVSPKYQPDGELSSKKAESMIERAMESGSYYFEWTHCRIDGTEFPATVLLSRMQMAGQVFLQAIVRDITHQKEAESKLADYATELERRQIKMDRLYQALDSEMQNARQAHQRLVQQRLPSFGKISLAMVHQPATYIGGDFSYVIQKDDKFILYVSDVTGHGLEGTIFGLFVKGCIEAYLELVPKEDIKPHKILSYLDKQVRKSGYPSEYAVAIFIMVMDVTTRKTAFSAAGFQNPPLLVSKDGSLEPLISRGLPISPDIPEDVMDFGEHYTNIPDDAVLFLSTDGLYEQDDGSKMYERRALGLLEQYGGLPSETVADLLQNDFLLFMGGEEQSDDVTYIVLSTAESKKYQLPSDLNVLDRLWELTRSYYQDHRDVETIVMAVHELVVNAIEHGNKFQEDKRVVVAFSPKAVVIEDEGEGFDWHSRLDNTLDLESSSERGRGISMAQLFVEHLIYNQKGNRVSLVIR